MKLWIALAASASLAVAADAPKRPRITGVAHLALFVQDVGKARAFYQDLLGYGEPFSLNNPDGTLSLTFIKINERQYLELFPERAPQTDRLNHISVETDDIEGMRAYLASKGVKVPDKANRGRIGNLSFNAKDPEGHTVEFVQYMPEAWTAREKGKYMPATRISPRMMHIGIVVTAIEPEMKFYRDVLGFKETWRGSRDGKILNWVNMKVPDGDDYIEFMLYETAPAPTARGSAHHICLEVGDMDKAVAVLEARPARKDYSRKLEIRTGINRRRQCNLFDADGTRTELMEPHPVDGVEPPSSTATFPR